MYCEDCHSDVPDGTIKCPFCGSHLTISKEKHIEKQAEEAERVKLPTKNPTRLNRNSMQIIAV